MPASIILFSLNTILTLNDYRDTVRRSAEGDRKALCSPPQRQNPFATYERDDLEIDYYKAIALLKAEVSRLRARPKGFPIALWKPSGPSPCCQTLNAAQDHSSFIRSYIMMPAATAALRDSAPPRMGSFRRWVASAFTPSDTPFPSLPITRQKRSPTSPRR